MPRQIIPEQCRLDHGNPERGLRTFTAHIARNVRKQHLDQGYLKMDNNYSEQRMKPIALGRKNYLFVDSDRGGQAAAIYYSIIETCKNYRINPLQYLTETLAKSPDCKTEEDFEVLLPSNLFKQ